MYIPLDPLTILLCLGLLSVYLWLSAPVSAEEREWKRDAQARRQTADAAARALRATEKASRQAWRRRVFGSHPVLYWGMAWLGMPILLCVSAVLMGW